MTTALLDVNVLLALAWPNHQHHGAARRWFEAAARRGWATCALTELAFVRLSANPAYTEQAVGPLDALKLLLRLCQVGKHREWTALPPPAALSAFPLVGHQQVTDAYLVVVARHHKGVLATFDTRLAAWEAARGHVLLLPQ